ncbi:MAG TPA: septal ring lytic transglycosylase RlpA family protein [Candidatus Obscuribacterales bacterium]
MSRRILHDLAGIHHNFQAASQTVSSVVLALFFTVFAQTAYGHESTKPVCSGKADFYSSSLHGNRTASGAKYDENKLTAAHKTLPFGTKLTVVNRKNGKTCTLVINDRGPFTPDRVIDVSKEAAKQLGLMNDRNRMVDCYIRIDKFDFRPKVKTVAKETTDEESTGTPAQIADSDSAGTL